MMDTLFQDLRYAIRQFIKSRGFTAVAVVTLALGVGANTAVFSLANWALLRPLPGIEDDGRFAVAYFPFTRGTLGVSPAAFDAVSNRVTAFTGLAAGFSGSDVALVQSGRPVQRLFVDFVTPNYFSVLGTRTLLGRVFTGDQAKTADVAPVALISERLWVRSLDRDPAVVGRVVKINGASVTVLGVMAGGFQGINRTRDSDLWLPYQAMPGMVMAGGVLRISPEDLEFPELFGRLAPGATTQLAELQLRLAKTQMMELTTSPQLKRFLPDVTPVVRSGLGTAVGARDRLEFSMQLAVGVSAIVLLIAAANVANLLLFRAVRRREELALRRALGAGEGRLIHQSVMEGIVIAGVSSVAAIGLAMWLVARFRGFSIPGIQEIGSVGLDVRVLGYGLLVAFVVGTVVGLVPPLLASRTQLSMALKDSSVRGSGRRGYLRGALAVVQLSACLTLLVAALLLTRTIRNLQGVDTGFDATGVNSFALEPAVVGYPEDQAGRYFRDALDRVRTVPGVDAVGLTWVAPFSRVMGGTAVWRDAASVGSGPDRLSAVTAWASPGYFAAMGVSILAGRPFIEADFAAGAEPVAVISEGLARKLYGDRDPVGLTFVTQFRPRTANIMTSRSAQDITRTHRIVGTVGNTRWMSVTARESEMLFRPYGDPSMPVTPNATLLVRSTLSAVRIQGNVRAALAELADVPVRAEAMTEKIDRSISEQRLFARLLSVLSGLAVLLAGIGLYSLIAFSVAERRKEFGIRVALGAQVRQILDHVARQGALLAGIGAVVGLAGAFGLSRLITRQLFGVTPLEPYVYLLATALLVLVAISASVIPALAAARVDPMTALRSE